MIAEERRGQEDDLRNARARDSGGGGKGRRSPILKRRRRFAHTFNISEREEAVAEDLVSSRNSEKIQKRRRSYHSLKEEKGSADTFIGFIEPKKRKHASPVRK